MKLSAVVVSRNDNYGGNLADRATYCLNSLIDTFDEVFYIDWNSETHSLLYDIEDRLIKKGNLKHIVIPPDVARTLTNGDPQAQVCCETLGRNLGIRRATGDYIVSTNIDVIAPRREDLEKAINELDKNTFYTISRRHTDWETIEKFHGNKRKFEDWEKLRDHLIENSEERKFEETVVKGDDYSIINCCGDFQLAHKDIWNEIKGFEEELIYVLYSDTNVQKKAIKHGFDLKAIYSPALFHIYHGKGGGGFLDGVNRKTNDMYRAVTSQDKTENKETWGFSPIEIEYELL
mgnify:CR=1 FL=1|tara:strand:+ start:500 stop:1369 length:870 start_codon:yes stop_codon:yes gene_type:complete